MKDVSNKFHLYDLQPKKYSINIAVTIINLYSGFLNQFPYVFGWTKSRQNPYAYMIFVERHP